MAEEMVNEVIQPVLSLETLEDMEAPAATQGVKASCISITIRGNDMKKHSHQRMLDAPTDGTTKTYETARELFRQLWDGKTNLRLIGLAMTQLDRDGQQQMSLFGESEKADEREHNADKAVDALREKFGADIIKRGGMLNSDIKVRKR